MIHCRPSRRTPVPLGAACSLRSTTAKACGRSDSCRDRMGPASSESARSLRNTKEVENRCSGSARWTATSGQVRLHSPELDNAPACSGTPGLRAATEVALPAPAVAAQIVQLDGGQFAAGAALRQRRRRGGGQKGEQVVEVVQRLDPYPQLGERQHQVLQRQMSGQILGPRQCVSHRCQLPGGAGDAQRHHAQTRQAGDG